MRSKVLFLLSSLVALSIALSSASFSSEASELLTELRTDCYPREGAGYFVTSVSGSGGDAVITFKFVDPDTGQQVCSGLKCNCIQEGKKEPLVGDEYRGVITDSGWVLQPTGATRDRGAQDCKPNFAKRPTATPIPPTSTNTPTATATPTNTSTPTDTATPTNTATGTPPPTNTPAPPTNTPPATNTPRPKPTDTPRPPAVPTTGASMDEHGQTQDTFLSEAVYNAILFISLSLLTLVLVALVVVSRSLLRRW